MVEWLGLACVAWTLFELGRLARPRLAARSATGRAPRAAGRAGPSRPSRPSRRYAAWDERGRRIVVEDLGRR